MSRVKPRDVLPRDHLVGCILLLLAEGCIHGYDLADRLGALGAAPADRCQIYRVLRAMERRGLVRSAWDSSPHGPQRRTYEVTAAGIERAGVIAAAARQADLGMQAYLGRYRRTVRRGLAQPVGDVPAAG